MILYRIDIPTHVADVIRHLPPDRKHLVKSAVRALAAEPDLGEPLRGGLEGFWKYRVNRLRIVYSVDGVHRIIRIVAVGDRRDIYDEVEALVRRGS